jgi:hypothetical protein
MLRNPIALIPIAMSCRAYPQRHRGHPAPQQFGRRHLQNTQVRVTEVPHSGSIVADMWDLLY